MTDPRDRPVVSHLNRQLYLIEVYDTASRDPDLYMGAYVKREPDAVKGGWEVVIYGEDDDIVAFYAVGQWRKIRQIPDTENNRSQMGKAGNADG